MSKDEFKDRIFDVLNETDHIPIEDIEADDRNSSLIICLQDGSRFLIFMDDC